MKRGGLRSATSGTIDTAIRQEAKNITGEVATSATETETETETGTEIGEIMTETAEKADASGTVSLMTIGEIGEALGRRIIATERGPIGSEEESETVLDPMTGTVIIITTTTTEETSAATHTIAATGDKHLQSQPCMH